MTAQPSLFGEIAEKEPSATVEVRTPKLRLCAFLRPVLDPWGDPDRAGMYWHERYHADLRELPPRVRDTITEILILWPHDHRDAARRMLDRFHRAHERERDNFFESLGH